MEHNNNNDNDNQQQQVQVSRLCYWWSVLMYNDTLDCSCVLTDLFTLKTLAIICKPFFKHIKPFIEDNFWFYQPKGKPITYTWFSPKKISGFASITTLSQRVTNLFSSRKECTLPISLTHIYLGSNFTGSLTNLPLTITHLVIGDFINPPIENLPHSIIYIKFGAHSSSSPQTAYFRREFQIHCKQSTKLTHTLNIHRLLSPTLSTLLQASLT
eukprot:TRINITY_DN4213_c0_g5_i1.p1 TRINITY_DN4213_c0_g5~~TRINITY_DN4213_c0_g5_i1.p1  ORF type:complete len:213 (-),score=46.90 TRINITY_DN4213_c0_g5_i1:296-934(-)